MDDDLSARCAKALADAAAMVECDEGSVHVDGHALRLDARVENDVGVEGRHLLALGVGITIDDIPQPVRSGLMGIGRDREEALSSAVEAWPGYAGLPIVGAAAPLSLVVPAWRFERSVVFSGAVGVIGSEPIGWPPEHTKSLVRFLMPLFEQLPDVGPTLHSLSLAFKPSDGTGDVRVDGVPQEELLPGLREYPWPAPEQDYIVKQFFVARSPQ